MSFALRPKHVAHSTGLPCVGLNGTVVLFPHSEQLTCVSIRRRPLPPSLLALHCLHRFGSFVNPFPTEEFLFSRRKYKRHTAIYTQDFSVIEVHKNPSFRLRRFGEEQL